MALAAGTIDDALFMVFDKFPGVPEQRTIPYDFFTTSAARHNVAAANFYPIGAKVQVYDTSKNGFATFGYYQLIDQSAVAVAAKILCGVAGGTDNSDCLYWKLCNDPADLNLAGSSLAAYALSAMTDAYYGWFWIGGICPTTFVSGLDGNYNVANEAGTAGPLCWGVGDYVTDERLAQTIAVTLLDAAGQSFKASTAV